MRSLLALSLVSLVFLACSTPAKKVEDPENDQIESETCCCRWVAIGSENGRPTYEDINRMECSEKQGECMAIDNCGGPAPSP